MQTPSFRMRAGLLDAIVCGFVVAASLAAGAASLGAGAGAGAPCKVLTAEGRRWARAAAADMRRRARNVSPQ